MLQLWNHPQSHIDGTSPNLADVSSILPQTELGYLYIVSFPENSVYLAAILFSFFFCALKF